MYSFPLLTTYALLCCPQVRKTKMEDRLRRMKGIYCTVYMLCCNNISQWTETSYCILITATINHYCTLLLPLNLNSLQFIFIDLLYC